MPKQVIEEHTVGNITYTTVITSDGGITASNMKALKTKALKEYRDSLPTACSFCQKSQVNKLVCAKVSTSRA